MLVIGPIISFGKDGEYSKYIWSYDSGVYKQLIWKELTMFRPQHCKLLASCYTLLKNPVRVTPFNGAQLGRPGSSPNRCDVQQKRLPFDASHSRSATKRLERRLTSHRSFDRPSESEK